MQVCILTSKENIKLVKKICKKKRDTKTTKQNKNPSSVSEKSLLAVKIA